LPKRKIQVEPSDPVTLLLTSRNIDLERQISDARRTIDEQRKEIEMLYKALERPVIATMTADQIFNLSQLVQEGIMSIPIKKNEKPS
jgi:hypothetical protein